MSNRILAQGIDVSNNTAETGLNNNDLIIGSSGSGKTGGYVIPNLQNLDGSIIVSDTKGGSLERRFKDTFLAKGYKVYSLNLVNPELSSCAYNPLMNIRRDKNGKNYSEQDVLTLGTLLSPPVTISDPFWDLSAAAQISFYIAYALDALPPEEQTMTSVSALHGIFCQPGGRDFFLKWAAQNQRKFAAKKFNHINAVASSEKTSASINAFVSNALASFNFREAEALFGKSDSIDLADLGREKTVLFLNVSDSDSTFDRIVDIIYAQALQALISEADRQPDGRLPVPVRIFMDDFAAGAKIPGFDKIISVIRSRDISVSLVLQSLTQLESMYNRAEATTIINNCDHLIYLGTQDLDTAQFIAHHLCTTPEKVLSMALDESVIITKGQKARIAKKIIPYSTLDQSESA
ncbi:MAG: type IV secretory system conjugative DNA transfer family protein [Oscillospiraceae bacterium]|nr:type IV secretory system conjugative DNA transfer family protein [Oscillospiraceae bacterium]